MPTIDELLANDSMESTTSYLEELDEVLGAAKVDKAAADVLLDKAAGEVNQVAVAATVDKAVKEVDQVVEAATVDMAAEEVEQVVGAATVDKSVTLPMEQTLNNPIGTITLKIGQVEDALKVEDLKKI